MSSRKLLVWLGCAVLSLSLFGPAPSAQAVGQQPSPGGSLQVWDLNTFKMSQEDPAKYDYKGFIAYISSPTHAAYLPDLITLQEVSNIAADGSQPCSKFVASLNDATGQTDYACLHTDLRGGAAIVYRAGKLALQLIGGKNSVKIASTTINSEGCDHATTDPVFSIAARFKLGTTNKHVNVASVHLPNNNVTDDDDWSEDCAFVNTRDVDDKLDSLGESAIQIMAGDWNRPDTVDSTNKVFADWYRCTRFDADVIAERKCPTDRPVPNYSTHGIGTLYSVLGTYEDVIYSQVKGDNDPPSAYQVDNPDDGNLTAPHGDRRIDFIFAEASAVANAVTVPQPAAPALEYSDHKGLGALLSYS
jgi:hypothetical protein